ncbi:hypothetical protein AcW2_005776 [Taiwanofungus camphoratus]|nr:hypothetical protein AcW2_005776 [Antrodia cinnamomea]
MTIGSGNRVVVRSSGMDVEKIRAAALLVHHHANAIITPSRPIAFPNCPLSPWSATTTTTRNAHMFAQYSPLFTSGLLSGCSTPEHSSPSSSRSSSKRRRPQKEPRNSLPLTINNVSMYAGVRNSSDAGNGGGLFLTLMPHRSQADEGRSFLSLDLAESSSMRSMSLRRKDTVSTRATTYFGRSEPSSPSALSPVAERAAFSFSQFPHPPPVTGVRRSSREALHLPSPKPAPSTSLPEPPARLHRRRPSDLTLTLSQCLAYSSSSVTPSSSMHRATQSAPSLLSPPLRSSPILSPEQSYFMFSPTSPATPPPLTSSSLPPASRRTSPPTPPSAPNPSATSLKPSPSMRSAVSHNTRQLNRSAALAMLEGRSCSRSRSRSRPRNFMSMSDDEDEPEPEPCGALPVQDVQRRLMQVLREEEDLVLPASAPASAPGSNRDSASSERGVKRWSGSGSTPPGRRRRGTIESFLSPLANFIDLKDDDFSTHSWRSFVEVST